MRRILTLLLWTIVFAMPAMAAERVTVTATVESREVYVGERFTLQIRVDGNESPQQPNMSALERDFTVQFAGGQQNSSSSVSIINGKMTRQSQHGYFFNFNLVAKHNGQVQIPAIVLTADGRDYTTRPFSMLVKEPEENDDFKLRLKLAKNKVYVGEPVEIAVTWYVGKDVRDFNFNLPFLDSADFALQPHDIEGVSRDKLVRIPFAKFEVIGEKSSTLIDNKRVMTVSFSFTLFPKKAGDFILQQGTVSCEYLAGYRQSTGRARYNGFFDDDFFGGGLLGRNRKVYRTAVVPSNVPQLKVLPLPAKGRPADFNGLVGDYSLAVSASPLQVKVGDPITLTVQVAGNYINDVQLSPLAEQLGVNFKVPTDMAPGVIEDDLKTFTQTIRARRPGVKAIPPIGLSFFNVQSERYETATSDPISLQVKAVKLVTAQDAEGGGVAVRKNDLLAAKGGINFNYEGVDVLILNDGSDTAAGLGIWYWLMGLPPLLFAMLFAGKFFIDRRRNNPHLIAARRASAVFRQELGKLKNSDDFSGTGAYGQLAKILREYLAAKMNLNSAALSYNDVEPGLLKMGLAPSVLRQLQEVFAACEAVHFSGGASGVDFCGLVDQASDIVKGIEGL